MWRFEYLNEVVRSELRAQPDEIRAKFTRILNLINVKGLESVREPYIKHLDGKLWEMRVTGKDGIARAIYVTASERRIVVLRVFTKKTEKTPHSELDLARRRAKEIR